MGAQKRGYDVAGMVPVEPFDDPQHLQFVRSAQAVTGLDFHGRGAQRQHLVKAGGRGGHEVVHRCRPGVPDRTDDSPTGRHDIQVRRALDPQFEFGGAVAAEDRVGMSVYKSRANGPAPTIYGAVGSELAFQLSGRSDRHDPSVLDRHRTVLDHAGLRHIRSALWHTGCAGYDLLRIMEVQIYGFHRPDWRFNPASARGLPPSLRPRRSRRPARPSHARIRIAGQAGRHGPGRARAGGSTGMPGRYPVPCLPG